MADPELSLHWFRFVGGIYYEKTLLNSCRADYDNWQLTAGCGCGKKKSR